MAELSPTTESGMIGCPVCSTELEPWQINCHGCGQSISSFEIPIIKGDAINETDLTKAFQKWIRRGKLAFKSGSYDEAHACFAEALKRVKGLEAQRDNEIKARQKLADAFLKLNKTKEAIEQLVRASHLSSDELQKQTFQKRIDHLNAKLASAHSSETLQFRFPRETELISAPLYCGSCHRLLSEAEVYRIRSAKELTATCVCGFNGKVITPEIDAPVIVDPVMLGPPLGPKKAQLIEAAHQPVERGRDRKKAIWLAVALGNFGAHKFYLGERATGIIYLILCPTLVPWLIAFYDAVLLAQMSRVSFNLIYNIEEIVRRLPPELDSGANTDVYSMEVSEDPDDLLDAWSMGDETITSGTAHPTLGETST